MPRRISDYPDAFAGWNLISSFGSIISMVATWLFLHIVYLQLVEGKATSRYPWLTPQFYSDTLQTLLNRSYNSLEWALTSPPKPHAFVSLPLQSHISSMWLSYLHDYGQVGGIHQLYLYEWFSHLGTLNDISSTMSQSLHSANDGIAWRDPTYLSHHQAIFDKASGDYELIKGNMLRCQEAFSSNHRASSLIWELSPKIVWKVS